MRVAALMALCSLSTAYADEGPLSGLTIYLSAGHGYVVHHRGEGWQRPVKHGLLEDTWTARFASRELIPALERAGATVLTARERDPHRERVLVDDRDPGFSCGQGLQRGDDTLIEAEDQGTWTLTAPHAGSWQLYARWRAEEGQNAATTYRVHTAHETSETVVDQQVHGGEWWPLARLDLDAGDWVRVDVEGSGIGMVSADAVRLGGGQYTLATSAGPRDVRAWEAAAVHHLEQEGVPEEVWNVPGGGLSGDASARARWADWSHPPGEEAVYLSLHTDAGGGSGTTAFVRRRCTDCDPRSLASTRLADAMREQVVAQVREKHSPEWRDRGTRGASLAEVSDELNPEIPAALIELGFHDHKGDAAMLADGAFQATLADALTHGIIRYRDPAAAMPPAPAADVIWAHDRLTWTADPSDRHGSLDGWVVRTRSGSARWSEATHTTATALPIPADTEEVEIRPIGAGGEGRPVRIERMGTAVAETTD
ncbi:MAG: N-acetylmuramoyl-L-alanine amidase [Proteobacteria bacterium]|nr:N-acetylmuramoyl-L-alanine amidase [Pseudomonadota bacterium]